MSREWLISGTTLPIGDRTLVMGILNVTPDSFSDGDQFLATSEALAHAERLISEGADIIDVGGESTRPGAGVVTAEEEISRVVPTIELLATKTRTPVSIDTTKSLVARAALDAGAAIVNDISALRFDLHIADEAAKRRAGLVLMHSRGTPATLHRLPPVVNIMEEVTRSLLNSVAMAKSRGVSAASLVIDPGIGFGKTQEQNLEIIARMEQIVAAFPDLPVLIGTSRKSFLGRLLLDESGEPAATGERLMGTLASVTVAVLGGAHLVRVHDVKPVVETLKVVDAIKKHIRAAGAA